ncbi:MAG TPA: hypothetical protein VND64_16865 [Pirellulales bacterium]|nr:hypothetical protein [Pirellulales bacterium]
MKTTGIVIVFLGVLQSADGLAMAADRPGALGAMGLGGTLAGSADRRPTGSAGQTKARRFSLAVYRQQQRGQYLDDRLKRAEHYFEMRRMNESYRAERRSPPLTPEQLANLNESRLPRRLTAQQWQPAAGIADWPAPLRGAEHAADRARLEQLFAERTPEDSGIGGTGYGEVRRLTRKMRDQLARRAKELSVEEYSVARKFINSLAYEARFTEVAAK